MRSALDRCATVLSLVLALGLVTQVSWAKRKAPKCSIKICKEGIAGCISTGEKRKACKKGVVQACRLVGAALCLPPTTTTTIPPVPTTLDVNGVWALAASQTANPCGIDAGNGTLSGEVAIDQNGSVLAGHFGENTLAGQFTAPDAFIFALGQFCSADDCCGEAALSASAIAGSPGRLAGRAVFALTARCKGLTCLIQFDGTLTQEAAGGGGGPKR